MKLAILLSLVFFCAHATDPKFKRQKSSPIHWNEMTEQKWLDFKLWKKTKKIQTLLPDWRKSQKENRLIEPIGKILECVGKCQVNRGIHHFNGDFLTELFEQDEIITRKDSYIWIFLLDGTMVRLSPNSSIRLQEINIAKDKITLFARINHGNIVWHSRLKSEFTKTGKRETDTLFLPLKLLYDPDEKHTFKNHYDYIYATDKRLLGEIDKLNNLIKENNKLITKDTHCVLVMPQGTIEGKNLQMELIVLLNNNAYFKRRRPEDLGQFFEQDLEPISFSFRNFLDKEEELDEYSWYKINWDGNRLTQERDDSKFAPNQFLTSHTPSIWLAREIWLKNSSHLFQPILAQDLGSNWGYKLWDKEIENRINFFKKRSHEIETTNILNIKTHYQYLKQSYNRNFFKAALHDYYLCRLCSLKIKLENPNQLNSTKKKFWKVLHDKKLQVHPNFSQR